MIQVKIRGELWTIRRENRPGLWGECDWDKCLITLKKNLRLRNRLETLVHELVHALFPDAPEAEVEEAGDVIHKVLLADGWGRGKCRPRKETMRKIRESQVEGYEVVKLQAGDTIPAEAIEIEGEWHVPSVKQEVEPKTEPATKKPKKAKPHE
jgi:hypothetical protein